MLKTIFNKNYINIIKHKFLPLSNELYPKNIYFTFLRSEIKIDTFHLANRNLIRWCINSKNFKKRSNCNIEILYEKAEMNAFEKLIEKSNYFIDIGAQNGIYSLAAYKAKNIKKIICLDIMKDYIRAIKSNIKLNDFSFTKFHFLNFGLGLGNVFHKEWIGSNKTKGISFEKILKITSVTLSENDCVKVDIEGWEFSLFETMIGKFFLENKPKLLLSFHTKEIINLSKNNISEEMVFNYLSLNYKFKYITNNDNLFLEIFSLKDQNLDKRLYKTIIFSNIKL